MSEHRHDFAATAGLAGLLQALQPGRAVAAPLPPDLDAIRATARAEGFAAGEAAATEALAPLRARLAAAADSLDAARAIDPDGLRPLVLQLVRSIAETVLAAELQAGARVLQPLVDAGLAALGPGTAPTLIAHPDTLAALLPHLPDLATRADPGLALDEFRLEGGAFVVETGLAARLAEVLESVR